MAMFEGLRRLVGKRNAEIEKATDETAGGIRPAKVIKQRRYRDWTTDEQYDYQIKGKMPADGIKPL